MVGIMLIAPDAEITDNLLNVTPAKSRIISYASALLDFAKPVEAKDLMHGKDPVRIIHGPRNSKKHWTA